MKWTVTAHRDWQRLDILQFELELARKEIDNSERGGAWVKGEPHLRDSGFIVTPTGDDRWA